jgi:hypothetical protein
MFFPKSPVKLKATQRPTSIIIAEKDLATQRKKREMRLSVFPAEEIK